ncbi:hypothetical protein KM043_005746 [Ampulex compressa]|nr:hypothetical protein KM043_005746 [Ampulex compressa]
MIILVVSGQSRCIDKTLRVANAARWFIRRRTCEKLVLHDPQVKHRRRASIAPGNFRSLTEYRIELRERAEDALDAVKERLAPWEKCGCYHRKKARAGGSVTSCLKLPARWRHRHQAGRQRDNGPGQDNNGTFEEEGLRLPGRAAGRSPWQVQDGLVNGSHRATMRCTCLEQLLIPPFVYRRKHQQVPSNLKANTASVRLSIVTSVLQRRRSIRKNACYLIRWTKQCLSNKRIYIQKSAKRKSAKNFCDSRSIKMRSLQFAFLVLLLSILFVASESRPLTFPERRPQSEPRCPTGYRPIRNGGCRRLIKLTPNYQDSAKTHSSRYARYMK